MRIAYRGNEFDLQPASDGLLFGRSGNRELHIAPHLAAEWIKRGIMIVKTTTPHDEHDPGEVISSTCEACSTKFEGEQRPTRKCTVCGKLGCPKCGELLAFTQCDICDEDLCSECRRTAYGSSVICLKPACRAAALEGLHNSQMAAADQQSRNRAAFFTRRSA